MNKSFFLIDKTGGEIIINIENVYSIELVSRKNYAIVKTVDDKRFEISESEYYKIRNHLLNI